MLKTRYWVFLFFNRTGGGTKAGDEGGFGEDKEGRERATEKRNNERNRSLKRGLGRVLRLD